MSVDNVPTPRLARLDGLLADWQAYAETAHDAYANGRARGPVTGFQFLDEELGHALQPGVHVLNGDSGAGKTAFAGQVAASCGVPALYVSCEMPLLELFRRHTARVTGTFLKRLKSGEITPERSLELAQQTATAAPLLSLADATQAPATPKWLQEFAPVARGESEHFLIVIDSVHSWVEGLESQGSEYEALNAGLRILRSLALDLQCPVLAIAERNRASVGKGGLSSGAGSRKIEYGAESVIDLNRDEKAAGDLKPITLVLSKNRHGTPGRTFKLTFDGAKQLFTEGHPS